MTARDDGPTASPGDPTAWKRPRRRHDDLRDDFRRLLREARAAFADPDLTVHGQGYVRGRFDGIVAVVRLTLSEDELNALGDDADPRAGRAPAEAAR